MREIDQKMNLITFKQAITVLTVFVATCLFPDFAQAQTTSVRTSGLLRPSGRSTTVPSDPEFRFDLNIFADNQGNGNYPNAIQNLNFSFGIANLNESFCGNLVCPSANLRVTRLGRENILPGLNFPLNSLTEQLPRFNFGNAFRADITLATNSVPTVVLIIEDNPNNLIDNLSGLSRVNLDQIAAIYSPNFADDQTEIYLGKISSANFPKQISEPGTTAILLGMGALGALTIQKRQKNFK